MSATTISVVIPTRNGASTLPALLDSLWAQKTQRPLETIVVDSGSTDRTLDILKPRVTTLVQIEPSEFDHGLTRNTGVARATGDFVVLLVQDALPVSSDFIVRLTAPLLDDATLAGTFARQQPRQDASPLTRASLERYAATQTSGWTSRLSGGEQELATLAPIDRLHRCTFDNVASCIRRSVWLDHPFAATPIAEDLSWAREVLLAGYGIRFVPDAVVTHSHDRSFQYEFERTRALHEQLYRLFELQTIPDRMALARAVATSLAFHFRCERQSPGGWVRAAALAVAWPAGQYAGARRARTRRPQTRLRPGLV